MLFLIAFASLFCQTAFRPTHNAFRNITSPALVAEIKIGWNLGNALDSVATGNTTPQQHETAWGNPVTTPQLIQTVIKRGFNCIRVCVTWDNEIGAAPDYTIKAAWMNRVQEVVDYAYTQGAYVILNTHHEEGWLIPSKDREASLVDKISKIWIQIADRFKDYDEHLIFEGLNEPRTQNSQNEWNGGTQPEREVVNSLNAAFVNVVRTTGGNNPQRHLIVTPYAGAMYTSLDNFVFPRDPADRLILAVHNYYPYEFVMQEPGTTTWGSQNDRQNMASMAKILGDRFTNQGRAVIMDESGVTNKNNLEPRIEWCKAIVTELKKNKVPLVWWDNGVLQGSGDKYRIINRQTYEWDWPTLTAALIDSAQ